MTPQSVQREVARVIHHEKFLAARPWLIKTPTVRYAMILIRYNIIDGDGDRLTLHTWSIGSTVKAALKAWRERNPSVRDSDFDHEIVTEPKQREREIPKGDRIEPPDPFLASS